MSVALAFASVLLAVPLASQVPDTSIIPELTTPPTAARLSAGGYGAVLRFGRRPRGLENLADDTLPAGRNYRIGTDLSSTLIADHYTSQLVAAGWIVAFKQIQPMLGLVRFSAGPAADPLVGTLMVVPFAATREAIVDVQLIRSRATWRVPARGGGAGASTGMTINFGVGDFSRTLRLPPEVVRAEGGGGGGSPDRMQSEMRLQTSMAPSLLMAFLQAQLVQDGWKTDAVAGDPAQAVVRRSTSPAADKSELWMLTSMPGTDHLDLTCIVIASTRAGVAIAR